LKTTTARDLRRYPTYTERKLWSLLRRKQIAGCRFRRQQPIGPFIADFYCATAKLVVELDGPSHHEEGRAIYDEARSAWLSDRGIFVLRFENEDVVKYPQRCLERIWQMVEARMKLPDGGHPE